MTPDPDVSRRGVLKASALVVAFSVSSASVPRVATGQEDLPGSLEDDPRLNSWIAIREDGVVTVYTGKVELGQGIKTAIIQVAADELDVDVDRVDLITAETGTTPDEGYTAGSQSMEDSATAITYAAADARRILLESAADELEADPETLSVDDGRIVDDAGNELTYWDIAAEGTFDQQVSLDAEPKAPQEQDVVGEAIQRVDIPDKIMGDPHYVQDLRNPAEARGGDDVWGDAEGEAARADLESQDLLHGRVVRPPGYAGQLEAVDDEAVREMPGVVEVARDGSFLGVVAQTEWQAIQAWEALRDSAEWSVDETLPAREELYDHLRETEVDETVAADEGDVEGAIEGAARTLEAEYRRPYMMHATIGPSAAVAEIVSDDQQRVLNVWTHSQGVYPLREALFELMGSEEQTDGTGGSEGRGTGDGQETGDGQAGGGGNGGRQNQRRVDEINCTHIEGSGCYGHNGADDVAGDAAVLSDAVDGRPVRVQWMRSQEHQWEPYGSAMLTEVRAGLSEDGQIVGWDYGVWSYTHSTRPPGQPLLAGRYFEEPIGDRAIAPNPTSPIPLPTGGGTRNSIPLYEFENTRVTHNFLPTPDVRVSALRALGAYANVFTLESFVDELAAAADADPVEFRLDHLEDDRAVDVIETTAELADWNDRDLEDNQGMGFGFAQYKNLSAYTAVAVTATVDEESGEVSVDQAFAVDDSGEVVNPHGVRQQIRGGIIQSTSWTLYEDVDFDAEGPTDSDWSDYPILTFPDVPDVEVELIDRPGEPYLGTGEAAQGPTAAAIANAVQDAVGARVRELPITADRVQSAME